MRLGWTRGPADNPSSAQEHLISTFFVPGASSVSTSKEIVPGHEELPVRFAKGFIHVISFDRCIHDATDRIKYVNNNFKMKFVL